MGDMERKEGGNKREKSGSLQRFAFVHETNRSGGVTTSNEVESLSYERPT